MRNGPTSMLAVGLMAASGFAALGYQIVWTQQSGLWLGHEAAAVLAVVAAFFGGLAVGALSLSARIDASPRPARWYAACEVVIGLWGLALVFLMAPVSDRLLELIGVQPAPLRHWSIVFVGTFLLLLPATAAMGATLPAMERIVTGLRADGSAVAMLYAGNTFGALLGVLTAAFLLVPWLGLSLTAVLCVLANFLCAAVTLKALPQRVAVAPTAVPGELRRHLSLLGATGFLGIGYEVLVVRVLSQVAENTVFTFAILLAVYLVGTALGAAVYSHGGMQSLPPEPRRDRILQSLVAACLLGVTCLAFAAQIKDSLVRLLGPGMPTALAVETGLAIAAFLLPTVAMGALFSHLATDARRQGIAFGRVIGANTLGAALAPLVCGVLLLPALGSTYALLLMVSGYLVLATRGSWFSVAQWSAAAAAGALFVWAPSLALIELPAGGRIVSHVEGTSATVSVIADASGIATLHINNRQQEGSSATLLADGRQGLLPILLHPSPRRALFLGLGTGATVRTAAEDMNLKVDAVELLPDVIEASGHFTKVFDDRENPRLRILAADARRFVRAAPDEYDVIVADNFHPARSGSGALYTVEHFAAVRNRLSPGGLYCQWLPLHQLDLDTLRSIVRSYLAVYPHGWVMLATNSLDTPVLGLVARRDGERIDIEGVRHRLATVETARPVDEFGITDDFALLGGFIAGPKSLATFARSARINTDDHPVVTYLAPRITYAPDSAPRGRLLELLGLVDIEAEELLAGFDVAWGQRLAAYWQARDHYLALGRDVRPTFDAREMLAQVQEPLLSVLQISPDFRPAYDPLLRLAYGIASSDSLAARTLLAQLARRQPARPEAAEALRALDVSP